VERVRSQQSSLYVGHVMSADNQNMTIQCMWRHRKPVSAFTFPTAADIHEYTADDIVSVLQKPKEGCGIYYFLDDLSPYSKCLH
jgi:hypothetical protein